MNVESNDRSAWLQDIVELLGLQPIGKLLERDGCFENRCDGQIVWRVLIKQDRLLEVSRIQPLIVHERRERSLLDKLLGRFPESYAAVTYLSVLDTPMELRDWSELRPRIRQFRERVAHWAQDRNLQSIPLSLSVGVTIWEARTPGWVGSFNTEPFEVLGWREERQK